MMTLERSDAISAGVSPARAWLRALELTAPIARNRQRTLATVLEEAAQRMPDAPALVSERESFTYNGLAQRTRQYARWALDLGLIKGDVICLMMPNRPEYFAIWLGLTSVGVVVSLLNTNLVGPSLAHCAGIVFPKHILVAAEFADLMQSILPDIPSTPSIWVHDGQEMRLSRIDLRLAEKSGGNYSCEPLRAEEARRPSIDDLALYIYTSGTTGLPKAAKVSHARVMQWSHWFAGMMDVTPTDRMYNCLPLYHSVGGVQAIGAMLVGGGCSVISEKFSASRFWDEVARWDCTLIQYIGELCRYLLHTDHSANETGHRVRLACGNGLAGEVWGAFKERFCIPQVLEFYASTESGVSLFNIRGKVGAIGHIPSYLTHRFSPLLVKTDLETGDPVRNADGFCIACGVNEAGEALGRIADDLSDPGNRFEGYTSGEASDSKILRNVLKAGDAWYRTGDLIKRDEKGYYYFVDRIGDTFRRKGENVATSEVAEIICECAGVQHANVYGVAVPGVEGRIGMAALAAEYQVDMAELHRHIASRLPVYARPAFLRLRDSVDLTGTFKYSKVELLREGYDPEAFTDPLFFDNGTKYVPLDRKLFQRIQSGEIRL